VRTVRDFPEDAYKPLIEAAPDGVVVVDGEGAILLANPEIARMSGWSADELIGQKVEVLVPPEARPRHVAHRDDFAGAAHSRPMGSNLQLSMTRKDGSLVPVEIMLSPVTIRDGRATIAFVRDATDRRRRQAALEEANAAMNASNKELEAFSYSVAHDLRAPLRSIDGFAQALLEDNGPQLDESGRQYLDRVRVNAQRMGVLIDDLLALARLSRSEVHRERVDLGRLAREAGDRLRTQHPGRAVELEIDRDLWVYADARMLGIAVDNLLGNAWKFTRPRDIAHVHVGRDAGTGAYFVRDDGVGFDMAHAQQLFAPFKRLHAARDFEGTGIGLATVARVVQRHGGRIWAEAAPGAGATFYFTLEKEDGR
jgi:PAS domain S-box-containing protein